MPYSELSQFERDAKRHMMLRHYLLRDIRLLENYSILRAEFICNEIGITHYINQKLDPDTPSLTYARQILASINYSLQSTCDIRLKQLSEKINEVIKFES